MRFASRSSTPRRARVDDAPFPISAGSPPCLQTFRPREPFASLAGSEPDGRWRLIVVDQAGYDGGEFTSWGLRLTMAFDTGDLANMELHGTLFDVIVHEMGHVLGIGTLWKPKLLVADSGTINLTFVGPQAMAEFGALSGEATPTPVPIANTGGPGTREGHWRESVFGNGLMTGFVDTGSNPLSRLTIASLIDIGYQADLDAADLFSLPSSLRLAILGVGGDLGSRQCCTLEPTGRHPGIVPLLPTAIVV